MMRRFLVALTLIGALICGPAAAGGNDPLFVNLTSDDAHRDAMAMTFSDAQLGQGHHITIWLNDKAVLIASKKNTVKFADQQKMLQGLIGKGATVIICPMCMKHFGVREADLLDGVKRGTTELTGAALFANNSKTLSW